MIYRRGILGGIQRISFRHRRILASFQRETTSTSLADYSYLWLVLMLHEVEKGNTPFLCETCFVRRSSILEKHVTCLHEANDNNNFLNREIRRSNEWWKGYVFLCLVLSFNLRWRRRRWTRRRCSYVCIFKFLLCRGKNFNRCIPQDTIF